ncbi:hypothetical protein [Acinetobacter rongchengensis]|uniref:Uncharacterized protein n=1 Tax=Acinetobacter rongchengensis TaxID=2419601 RepID=A0A3A8F101_9GAMM|nr:hypothetical protein [Acinetobacter rongchengensis]RKG40098.1 hypothetical protein D7V20_03230 [Acinetobacter rongchengensis]
MMKFIFLILIIATLYILWRWGAKHKINALFDEQHKALSQLVKNEQEGDELPEKSKAIKQALDAERLKTTEDVDQLAAQVSVVEMPVKEQDQRLFDEVAQLFFDQAIQAKDIQQAEKIQQEFLNKMPMNTQSQTGSFDFGEWSIFWSYHDQSLEYYVGRYGVFYAHVDREGVEHKAEFKDRY